MLVLPIVLTERLGLSAELAAIQLKQELSSAVPDWAQKAVNNVGAQVFATICIQDGGEVTGLNVSLQAPNTASVGSINFTCSVLIETFTRAQHRLKETVVEKWVSVAVEKRLKKGRELFDTSDQEIHQMISSLGYVTSSAHNQVEIQKYFFICLAKRELELREKSLSNHRKLDEQKKRSELQKILDRETSRAREWWTTRTTSEQKRAIQYRTESLPEVVQIVFAYREHHIEHFGELPEFNAWGEVSLLGSRNSGSATKKSNAFSISI